MTEQPQTEMFATADSQKSKTAVDPDLDGRLEQIVARQKANQFDWAEEDCVVLQEQLSVAVYRNKRDGIVIRQEGAYGDDDHFVVLRDDAAARTLIDAIQRELEDRG